MARRGLEDEGFGTPAAASWDDEDLPQPRERDFALFTRLRRPLGVLAVLALAALGVWKITTFKASDTIVADNSPSPSVHTSVRPNDLEGAGITVRIPVLHRDGTLFSERGPTCPKNAACATSSQLPAEVTAALRAAYPGARTLSSISMTVDLQSGHQLVSRSVHLAAGRQDVTVEVLARVLAADSGRTDSGNDSLIYVQHPNGRFTVRVTVVGPRTIPHVEARAAALAADGRLLAIR